LTRDYIQAQEIDEAEIMKSAIDEATTILDEAYKLISA